MDRRSHVAVVHTSFVLLDVLNRQLDRYLPDVKRTHIVEHSILQDVLDAGRVTADVTRRMLGYFALAEASGADVILNACSSVGETVDIARAFIRVPIVKIDEAMVAEAIRSGPRIGVVATLSTTLDPTCRLIEREAEKSGTKIKLTRVLCEGAFEALTSGAAQRHDQLVTEKLVDLSPKVDVIVLAQASMAHLVDALPKGAVRAPILSSPERAVRHVKSVLEEVVAKNRRG
ncbi:MAG: aspartate/glutamate racemase family protein [Anaerolineales bacterium]|jgi:Asp/Glu/hydantoin racemase